MSESFDPRKQAIAFFSLDGRVPVSQIYSPLDQDNDLSRTIIIEGINDSLCPETEAQPTYSVKLVFANDNPESHRPKRYEIELAPSIDPESLPIEEIQSLLGGNSPLNVRRDLLPVCKVNPDVLELHTTYANYLKPAFAISDNGLTFPSWTKDYNQKKNLDSKPYFFEITYPVPIREILGKKYGISSGSGFQDLLVTCGLRFANRNIEGIDRKIMNELIDDPNNPNYRSDLGERLRKVVDPYVSFAWQQD